MFAPLPPSLFHKTCVDLEDPAAVVAENLPDHANERLAEEATNKVVLYTFAITLSPSWAPSHNIIR